MEMQQLWKRASLRPFLVVAAISVITLAVSSPVSGRTSGSPVAAAGGATTKADCSRAAARELVERLHLGNADDPQVSEPVGQVLCGSFVGPGSQAMVVSLTIPSCGRTAGWVVFRFAGNAWQLVLTRNNGADLAAVGSDIQETMFVLRPGDAHCFPTGGTRARTWHWNGERFIASPWRQATPGAPVKVASFYSPSGNLGCEMGDDPGTRGSYVYCQSSKHPHSVRMGLDGRLKICRGGTIMTTHCLGNAGENTVTLGYGRQIIVGRFRCLSLRSGVKCTVIRSGKGFLIDSKAVRRVGR
jgi:hypothetical protein